jgi:hypothetical protein
MRRVMLVPLLLMVISCSPMSMVKDTLVGGRKSGISVDTELVVGDKKTRNDVQLGSKQTASTINNNQDEQVPPWVMLLLILGWILPSPKEIYREIKSWFGGGK